MISGIFGTEVSISIAVKRNVQQFPDSLSDEHASKIFKALAEELGNGSIAIPNDDTYRTYFEEIIKRIKDEELSSHASIFIELLSNAWTESEGENRDVDSNARLETITGILSEYGDSNKLKKLRSPQG